MLERGASGRTSAIICGVVEGLERPGRDQHAGARLVEHVLQLVGAVGRVDADQDRADLGRGVLQLCPFRAVRRPDADPVALLDTQADQAVGERVDVGTQLRVGPAPGAVVLDQRLPVAVGGNRAVEVGADRLRQERDVARAAVIGGGGGGAVVSW